MHKALFVPLQLSLGTFVCLSTRPLLAQVSSDGTVNTQVNQNGNVAEITGGETRGGNLFHSFQDFSIQTGNEAFFDNTASISNIFSRVTGGNISNIDGLIRANGDASLFLINPAGIIFGENARLDIGGSFYGSSASSILFEDGEFSAVNNLEQPILTVNAPIGLGFRDQPGDIVNRSVANEGKGLQVNSGNGISLLGGDLRFDGGRVTAPGGIVNLGGLTTAGNVEIEANNRLVFSPEIALSNISLTDNAIVDITSDGGGEIIVNANNLQLQGESLFLANIGEDLGTENAIAGTIELNTVNLSADNKSLIQADNLGIGKAGIVNINSETLNFSGGSAITSTTFGRGDAGIINITAEDITIDQEFSGVYSNVGLTNIAAESLELNTEGVVGNGGEININTGNLSLLNGARIISSSIAQGNGGAVNINASGDVLYQGVGETPVPAFGGGTVISGSFSQVQQDGVGNAGEVNITANSLTLLDTGAVLADNSGARGDAGDITLDIANEVFLDRGGLILAQVQTDAVGNGGDIIINAGSLDVRGDSFILADTKGIGDAGNINIDVRENVSIIDDPDTDNITAILTEVGEDSVGNAGNINIQANTLILENIATIAAQTKGEGNAGDINITTNEMISLANGAEIRSLVDIGATGNGGNVSLTTGELNLTNNSRIIADTTGISPSETQISTAGDISIDVSGDINLENSNQIQSQTRSDAVGNAGDITINAGGSLFSRGGNLILADSQARGNGGSIDIEVGGQIILEGLSQGGFPSQIVAGLTRENAEGSGGNIQIKASELILDDIAFISSNTVENSFGSAGNIAIDVNSLKLADNSFINVLTSNDSDGGFVAINSQTLDLESGGKILAATDGNGNGGNINLNVSDRITIDNAVQSTASIFFPDSQLLNNLQDEPSGIYANATPNATGNGGNINIGLIPEQSPQNLIIDNNGQILVDSEGTGSGGNLFLRSQNLGLNNDAEISAATDSGSGGNITLEVDDTIRLENNSLISARAGNQGDGGNININTNFIIAFPSGSNDIIANAAQGNGGNIEIRAESLLGIQQRTATEGNQTNDLDASSEFGLDGTVSIFTPDTNTLAGVAELPQNVVEPGETTAQACQSDRNIAASNQLTIQGKGGTIADPAESLDSASIIVDGQVDNNSASVPAPIETAQGKIQPARGIKVTESGEVILTAYHTDNAGNRLPIIASSCGSK